MTLKVPRITPCLWFTEEAEDAARFYTDIFPNSRIGRIARFGHTGFEHHGRPPGSVMTVEFFLDGQCFTALNGGPLFKFNEAISLMVACRDQVEIDYYWKVLGDGGPAGAQQCGWLKDKYGLSWQIVPENLAEVMADADTGRMDRAMGAILQMKKLDIAAIDLAMRR